MREALGSSVELFLVLDLVPGGSLKEALGKDGQRKCVLFVLNRVMSRSCGSLNGVLLGSVSVILLYDDSTISDSTSKL